MSKIIKNLWFKKNSKARKWLEENLSLEHSFSRTFRTTGGIFKYYENELLLKQCLISACNYQSVGSFPSKGGSKLSLCHLHVHELMQLQVATQPLILLLTGVKFGALQAIPVVFYHILQLVPCDFQVIIQGLGL